jgi:hypothetical protein
MSDLPNCRWRGGATRPGRFACFSLKLVKPQGDVSEAACRACHCVDHEPVDGLPAQETPAEEARCRFRGEELSGRERQRLGLDSRLWALCGKEGFFRAGQAVCPCTGCNSACPGYEKEEE